MPPMSQCATGWPQGSSWDRLLSEAFDGPIMEDEFMHSKIGFQTLWSLLMTHQEEIMKG
jgi:hypothetical protein